MSQISEGRVDVPGGRVWYQVHSQPERLEAYAGCMRDARLSVFEKSAHLSMLEEREQNLRVVREFLAEQ